MTIQQLEKIGFVKITDDIYQYSKPDRNIYGPATNINFLLNMPEQTIIRAIENIDTEFAYRGLRPELIKNPDTFKLTEMLEDFLDTIEHDAAFEDEISDFKHYIYEQCLKTFYGKQVFDWMHDK